MGWVGEPTYSKAGVIENDASCHQTRLCDFDGPFVDARSIEVSRQTSMARNSIPPDVLCGVAVYLRPTEVASVLQRVFLGGSNGEA